MFQATLNPMLVMCTCIIAGFILKKGDILPDNTDTVLSKLETKLLYPAQVLNTFLNYCTVASLKENMDLLIYSVPLLIVAMIVSVPLSRLFEKEEYQRNMYKYGLAFANSGFMGNAIVLAVFGEEMLYRYMIFTLPLQVGCYSWGISLLIPKDQKSGSAFKRLLNPQFAAAVVGAAAGLVGISALLPQFFRNTLGNLSGCMGPISMVLTGFVVGKYDWKMLLRKKKVYGVTFLRLLVLPAVFLFVLWLCGADELCLTVCLFAYATPLGLNTVVFPAAYGSDTSTGASMAMISHALSVLTIPMMYAVMTTLVR